MEIDAGIGRLDKYSVSIASYVVLTEAFLFVWASGPKPPAALISAPAIALQFTVFCATTLSMMTLLYVQWTGVGAPLVEGFQGRYWLSIMPLLFAATPIRWSLFEDPRRRIALALGAPVFGLADMALAVTGFYYR